MSARRAGVNEPGFVVEQLAQRREIAERDSMRGALEQRARVVVLDGAGGAQLVVERVARRVETGEPRGPSAGSARLVVERVVRSAEAGESRGPSACGEQAARDPFACGSG